MSLREDARRIIDAAIDSALPDRAVSAALEKLNITAPAYVIAVGKAAWQMGRAAYDSAAFPIEKGIVITKYGHSKGDIPGFDIYEAGHPVLDENSVAATEKVVELAESLNDGDTVVFLVSGGASALFEKPLIPLSDLERLSRELLACGADITEINTIRKRFSAVKGGRFAQLCAPAKVYAVILSDVLGDRPDMIASGPACPDSSTSAQAEDIVRKYGLDLTEEMKKLLAVETPKELSNVETLICGSVSQLCASAEKTCRELGYTPYILTSRLCCTARDAGVFLGNIAQEYSGSGKKLAFIAGGETVVRLTGAGLGGRNQELALAAAPILDGMENVCIFSVGSDGTDGPTDAAGGYADGSTFRILKTLGTDVYDVLQDNDSYHALQKCGGLIVTGATGTNVNDLSVVLIG